MNGFRAASLLLCVAFIWTALGALATARVAFINPPAFVPEQAMVTWYVRVPRHEANRLLIVAAFAEDGLVSETRRQLDGVYSQSLWNVNWRLPVGELELVAAVFDNQRQVGRDTHRVTVVAQGP